MDTSSSQTRAAVLVATGKPLVIEELAIPELQPGQVLVDVYYAGVCHSQLNEIRGLKGEDRFLPHTLGHEGSGKVIAVGEGVKKVSPGDNVVLTWIKGEGADVPSTVYQGPDGPVNSGAISAFMNRTVTCENRVVSIPVEIPFREAALLGCAIPTGAGIVFNTIDLQLGETIAIFGIGGIGNSAILAAKARGAGTIIAVDIQEYKMDQARESGATHVVNAKQTDPVETIMKITDGRGVDYAIESAGTKNTMETAFRSVRTGGGLCVLAGNLPHGEQIQIDPFSLVQGKRIIGTWGGETKPDRDIPGYVDYYLAGKLDLGSLITHTYALDEINQAFDHLEKGGVGRILIDMSIR